MLFFSHRFTHGAYRPREDTARGCFSTCLITFVTLFYFFLADTWHAGRNDGLLVGCLRLPNVVSFSFWFARLRSFLTSMVVTNLCRFTCSFFLVAVPMAINTVMKPFNRLYAVRNMVQSSDFRGESPPIPIGIGDLRS